MKNKHSLPRWGILSVCVFSALVLLSCKANRTSDTKGPVKIIFDSDFGPDYDDVGALTILHALADSGKAEILATMASNRYKLVAPAMEVLNNFYGRPEIPIGAPKNGGVNISCWQHWTDSLVAKYPHKLDSTSQALDAVALYRKILASQPDTSVVIVTVGFLTNMRDLLMSKPDSNSALDGKGLVLKKVRRLVSMAGRFPEGSEFNVQKDSLASKYTFENWPSPVVFSGFEIGSRIFTGRQLVNSDVHSPAKDVFRISMPMAAEDKNGRMSWDETAVITAVLGVDAGFSLRQGWISVDSSGYNHWKDDPKGNHSRLEFKKTPEEVGAFMEKYMMHQPISNLP